jgi:alpha-L-arabinofuranosidase
VNASSDPQPVEIHIEGVKLAGTGKLVTLSAKNPRATNSIDDPDRILPVPGSLKGISNPVRQTAPPYSIQVVQFDVQ